MANNTLLIAECYNGGCHRGGYWGKTRWNVKYSGACRVRLTADEGRHALAYDTFLPEDTIEELKELLISGEWEAVDRTGACDGELWSFKMWDENGEVIRSTDGDGYIYGLPSFENIVALLPDDSGLISWFNEQAAERYRREDASRLKNGR